MKRVVFMLALAACSPRTAEPSTGTAESPIVQCGCGNGKVDAVDEECDLGEELNGAPDSPCLDNCRLRPPVVGEPPDAGSDAGAPTGYCGDGILDLGEECDEGVANGGLPAACGPGCRRPVAICGNATLEPPEECDAGEDNGPLPAACSPECTRNPSVCGDGHLQGDEPCDGGEANGQPESRCSAACTIVVVPELGNGVVEPGEECDDGNTASGDGCDESGRIEPGVCGNGVIDPGEECDLGRFRNGGSCTESCRRAFCGDGLWNPELEECDEGSRNGSSRCAIDCTVRCVDASCGSDPDVPPDAGVPDAGVPDAGVTDGGRLDGGIRLDALVHGRE